MGPAPSACVRVCVHACMRVCVPHYYYSAHRPLNMGMLSVVCALCVVCHGTSVPPT